MNQKSLSERASEIARVGGWWYSNHKFCCTDSYSQILGWQNEQEFSIQKFLYALNKTESRREMVNTLRSSIKNQNEFAIDVNYITGEGVEIYLHIKGIPICQEERLIGYEGIIQNITEYKAAEHSLQYTYLILGEFQNAIYKSTIVSKTDKYGMITFANQKFCQISKYEEYELIGKSHAIINSRFHSESFWRDMWQTIKKGQYWRREVKNRAKDGSYYWVDTYVVPLRDPDGKIDQYISVRNDITEKKQLEEKLLVTLDDLNEAQKIAALGNWQLDLQNQKLTWSDGVFEIFEIGQEEFTGTYAFFLELVDPEDREMVNQQFLKSVEEHQVYEITHRIVLKNGTKKWVIEKANTIYDDNGKPLRTIGTIQDITKIKKVQLSLEEARKNSEAANIAKSQFLANMSHEIRTPLNGVIGFSEILQNSGLNKNQMRYAQNIINSAKSLLTIINDILDFSKIEAGKLELEYVPTNITELLEQVADILKFESYKKRLEFLLNIDSHVPSIVLIDPVRLKQVLVNLAGNAIKFTSAGEVEIKLDFEKKTDKIGLLHFSVRDTGIGITKEEQQKLFQPFVQADSSITRKYGGTGLGLAISFMLIEKMNSKIHLNSKYRKGSVFSFSLEVKYEQYKIQNHRKFKKISHAYIIDSNQKHGQLLKKRLKTYEIETTLLSSKEQINDMILNNELPHVLFYNLENRDIFPMQKLVDFQSEVNIILMQASNDEVAIQKIMENHGIYYRVMKPIKDKELFEILMAIENGKQSDTDKEDEKLQRRIIQTGKQKKVLVIDDVELNRILVYELLNRLSGNYLYLEADNGKSGLECFQRNHPDLVLLDVQMPVMDGYDCVIGIRKYEQENKLPAIPIIALTAGIRKEEMEKCLHVGMDGFIKKPIDKEIFDKTLVQYFEDEKKEYLSFNYRNLLYNLANKKDLIIKLLKMSLREVPLLIQQLERYAEKKDIHGIKQVLHKMKGLAKNLFFENLAILIEETELKLVDVGVLLKKMQKIKNEWNSISLEIERNYL